MKHTTQQIRILFLFSIILAPQTILANSPLITPRSQGAHLEREMSGWVPHTHLDVGHTYGTVALLTNYSKSFYSHRLTEYLFGSDLVGCDSNCRSINISGSGVAGRNNSKDWLADYFGLPRDYQSTISFAPRIESTNVQFQSFFGFECPRRGNFFLKVDLPIVYTKWNLHMIENIGNAGSANYQPGYFNGCITLGSSNPGTVTTYPNAYGVARGNLVNSFSAYACSKAVPNLGTSGGTCSLPQQTSTTATTLATVTAPGVTFDPLIHAQLACPGCNSLTKVGIADIHITFGWNAWQRDLDHVGFGLYVVIPTGNRPEGVYAFEPILGNGRHWELGFHFTSRGQLWSTEDEKQKLFLSVDSTISHLFGAKQKRTFDLVGKPNSRYMLAEKMQSTVTNLGGNATPGTLDPATVLTAQFAGEFNPVANLTTLPVSVSMGIQADTVFMLSYQHGDFIWDLGYNLWVRSCEKIKLKCENNNPLADGKTWALKGDAQVYGYVGQTASTTLTPGIIPLSATQSNATIHGGTNGYTGIDPYSGSLSLNPIQNPGVDNPLYAITTALSPNTFIADNPNISGVDITNPFTTGQTFQSRQVQTSVNPLFLSTSSIDINAARTKGLSNTLFTNIMYTWVGRRDHCDPYIGGGVEGEFHARAKQQCKSKSSCCSSSSISTTCCKKSCCNSPRSSSSSSCSPSCGGCNYAGLSQWSVWIKGGVSFD